MTRAPAEAEHRRPVVERETVLRAGEDASVPPLSFIHCTGEHLRGATGFMNGVHELDLGKETTDHRRFKKIKLRTQDKSS